MISIEQISGEIAALEEEKPTYVIMQKLANLYVVRDHLILPQQQTQIPDSKTISTMLDSEFMQAIDGKNIDDILPVIDEAMYAIQVLNPQLFKSIMKRIK